MPLRLILVPKSSPDWGEDADLNGTHKEFPECTTVGVLGDLYVFTLGNFTRCENFIASPTPELLAWAKESKK